MYISSISTKNIKLLLYIPSTCTEKMYTSYIPMTQMVLVTKITL
jgi:hypothetical protein